MIHGTRVTIFKPTSDEWYPSYDSMDQRYGKLVRVSLLKLSDGQWRVCAWGADDHGMERDYHTRREALSVFKKLTALDRVNHQHLKELGFVPA